MAKNNGRMRKLTLGDRIFGWGIYTNAKNIERMTKKRK